MIKEETIAILQNKFGNRIEFNRSMADLNNFGTGGPAHLFFDAKSVDDLSAILKIADQEKIATFLLGGGSNLLVSDKGYEGLVIKNSIRGLEINGTNITCGTGEDLQALVNYSYEHSLTGLEFATDIYGTVGGAIYGNAGAYGSETGEILSSAQVVDRQGNIRTEPVSYFEFGYRDSKLKRTGEIVVSATFALKTGNKANIRAKMDEISAKRKEKLPFNQCTAGCFFKNIPDKKEKFGKLAAGKLLEEAGAKSLKVRGAEVFQNHANIIINNGSASSHDIKKLSELLKAKVREKFNIELSEEITLIGSFEEESI